MRVIARRGDAVAADFADDVSGDLDVMLVETGDAAEAVEAAAGAVRDGVDVVAPVGGDGSINLAVEGMFSDGSADHQPLLAPVANGTANVINLALGLDTPADTVRAVRERSERVIDVGVADAGCFVLNASSGYDAAVIQDGADHSDSPLGRLEFLVAGVRRLRRDTPESVRVTCDGASLYAGRAMSVVVMNFGRRGGEFEVAPDARVDDGLLDVAVMRCRTLRRLVVVAMRLALGRPVDPTDVLRAQASRVEVEWSRPMVCQRDGDGDEARSSRLSYSVRPRALRITHG